jgi:hypothetical protein
VLLTQAASAVYQTGCRQRGRRPLRRVWTMANRFQLNPDDISAFVPPDAIYPGLPADENALVELLAGLSRDDTLLICARLNAMVTGFGTQSHAARLRLDLQSAASAPSRCLRPAAWRSRTYRRVLPWPAAGDDAAGRSALPESSWRRGDLQ